MRVNSISPATVGKYNNLQQDSYNKGKNEPNFNAKLCLTNDTVRFLEKQSRALGPCSTIGAALGVQAFVDTSVGIFISMMTRLSDRLKDQGPKDLPITIDLNPTAKEYLKDPDGEGEYFNEDTDAVLFVGYPEQPFINVNSLANNPNALEDMFYNFKVVPNRKLEEYLFEAAKTAMHSQNYM